MDKNRESFFFKTIITAIAILGISLSLVQFLFNRSMWSDEAFVALNIIDRSFFELLQPLEYNAVAPILFLQLEKIFSLIIPNTEYGFRIIPLISFWLSILFFYKILRITFKNEYQIVFCLSVFAINNTILYYSSETKQYMSDVLTLLALYYFLLKEYKNELKKSYAISLIGILSIFLSNTAPIVLLAAAGYLIKHYLNTSKNNIKYLILILSSWSIFFIVYYLFFIHNHPSYNAMKLYWQDANAFMPTNPFKQSFYKFFIFKVGSIIKSFFNYGYVGLLIMTYLMIAGIIFLKKSKNIYLLLFICPAITHLMLSAFKIYPFELRLILYTFPCVIILCGYGFGQTLGVNRNVNALKLKITTISVIVFLMLIVINNGINNKYDIKSSILFLDTNRKSSDKIYLSSLAKVPFKLYQKFSFTSVDEKSLILGERTIFWNGKDWDYDKKVYKDELDKLNGRVWFIFTGVGDEVSKRQYLKEYCKKNNKSLVLENHNNGSDAYLFIF